MDDPSLGRATVCSYDQFVPPDLPLPYGTGWHGRADVWRPDHRQRVERLFQFAAIR
jgi:hypothetical protein